MPRIGILEAGSPGTFPERVAAFRAGLAELGLRDGQNVALVERWGDNRPAELARAAGELVRMPVDVLFAGTTVAATAAKRATGTTPIVFAVPADPVGAKLVAQLARPGGNATGLTTGNIEIIPKRLELLLEVAGRRVSRVAVVFNPADASNELALSAAREIAANRGIEIVPVPVRRAEDFAAAFAKAVAERSEGLLVSAGALTDAHPARLATLAAQVGLPAVYGARGFVEAGGLISYSANFSDNYRRAAGYVERILRGARPDELSVEQASTFELAINLRAAKALGLSIPSAVRLRADVLIE